MNFNFNEEQLAIQALAHDFANQHFAPFAAKWDEQHIFPIDTLKHAASLGFAGIYVQEDVGGSALSRTDAAIIFEELSQACVSTAAYLSIHNMVGWLIDQHGNQQQRQYWLPKFCTFELKSSYCLTEPNAGSDAASLSTSAVLQGDHYIVNGAKAFISGGSVSDVYAVMVRTGEAGPRGISCLLIEKNTPGVSFGKLEQKLGWNSQPTTMVFFENCSVPAKNLIGQEGDGFKIAMHGLNGGRINIGACSLGGATTCLNLARDYMLQRHQFKKPLADFEALQFKLADMATELSAAKLLIYRAAHALDHKDKNAPMYCAMAKRYASDAGFKISNEALQIHGGYGYLKEYPIERFFRDLRVHQILEGTNEIMRVIIAKHLLG